MSGGGKGGGSATVGYRYFFGVLMGLCRGPVNAISEIKIGDRRAWIGTVQETSVDLIAVLRKKKHWLDEDIIISARIDTNGDGTLDPLVLGEVTAITGPHGSVGTIVVNSDGNMTFTPTPGYDNIVPTLKYTASSGTLAQPEASYTMGPIMSSTSIYIDAYNLFGGEKGEGGVRGTLEVKMGDYTQTMAGSLYSEMRSGVLPGFRRTVTAFFDGIVCMLSPYPKSWSFRQWRTTAGWENDAPWYPEKATILMPVEGAADFTHIHAMNPAHIIYECTTNREWGRGKDASAIDQTSFVECADQLFSEGFGLCLRWTRKDSISAFIQTVINHIGATIYTDRRTGLITLRLIRGGYNLDDLPHFTTENGLLAVESGEITSPASAVNMVEVKYRDPIDNEERTVKVGNLAALQSANGVVSSKSVDYQGAPVASLATRLAQRDLRSESSTIRRFSLKFDRRGYFIQPGSVIAISDPKRGIKKTAVRVGAVDVSNYRSGEIKVTALQDVFSLPSASYSAAVPPSWQAPNRKPCISDQKAFEMPYFMLARSMTSADLAYLSEDTGFVATASAQGQPMNLGYKIYVRDGAPTPEDTPSTTEYICS